MNPTNLPLDRDLCIKCSQVQIRLRHAKYLRSAHLLSRIRPVFAEPATQITLSGDAVREDIGPSFDPQLPKGVGCQSGWKSFHEYGIRRARIAM